MKMYTSHVINEGRWSVKLWIRRSVEYQWEYEPMPDIRRLIEINYDDPISTVAQLLLETVLGCEKVEVATLSGQGLFLEK
jgi:hypothetical protein